MQDVCTGKRVAVGIATKRENESEVLAQVLLRVRWAMPTLQWLKFLYYYYRIGTEPLLSLLRQRFYKIVPEDSTLSECVFRGDKIDF